MIKKTMVLIAAKHNEWLEIVLSFGCQRETAEDIVQEMYYKIHLKLQKGLDIMYNDKEINYYYVFKTLQTLFFDLKRKGKNITIVPLDDLQIPISDVNYTETYDKVKKELSRMYWYDRKVFEVINGGESIADFSRNSNIYYYSLYHTYKKVKKKLKKLL
tara:strand:+ start:7813 stop:8289 length:477 start_codon:yes stop_codon:yes gene_type:complete